MREDVRDLVLGFVFLFFLYLQLLHLAGLVDICCTIWGDTSEPTLHEDGIYLLLLPALVMLHMGTRIPSQ